MILFYGKHSLKQCIRGKPIKFGYKQWVVATPLGYAAYLDLHQGASAGHDRQHGIVVCAWDDNSVVTLASNKDGVFPMARPSRWSIQEKKKVQIDQPCIVQAYNNYTGRVDRLDQNVGAYRIAIHSKKWWWPLFAFLPYAAVNNAWLLFRMSPAHGHTPLINLGSR
ncbi:PiggyBac transposable element-derived protein 3 [Elysia marginata]|uniref:PiggyBac transposable element-derived protein 3 n=1 Tax=Elysia marginata TaxID=1093978 RepID=A0AAV4FQZ1_9GAST|nr:PiggyBac transposable element-derived protein 3 [Elysia marginata]